MLNIKSFVLHVHPRVSCWAYTYSRGDHIIAGVVVAVYELPLDP